jgi:UDP-N-acetylmuramoylalanine--D-glutamate ligase
MRELNLRGKRVTVVGLARSGLAACKVLAGLGATVLATDQSRVEGLRVNVEELSRLGVGLEAGGHTAQSFLEADLIIVSPGVDSRLPFLAQARSQGVPVWGEVELAYQLAVAPFIGITGTKGKGTVATLLGAMLAQAGRKAIVAGNIGRPLCDVVGSLAEDTWIVAELSSFQLEEIVEFRPRVAVLLNLAPDHLDRYPDVETYYAAKKRLFGQQTHEDVAVLNKDDEQVLALAEGVRARRVYFSQRLPVGAGASVRQGWLCVQGHAAVRQVCRVGELPASGPGILEDALAASATASILDIEPEHMAEALRRFPGRAHCMEKSAEIGGVRYVNDSKATNVFAVRRALEAIEAPVILIAGGRDKREDFRSLAGLVRERVKALVVIGEARPKILAELGDCCPSEEAGSLADAVEKARRLAVPGDVVLMSPGCASFDMFENAEQRGEVFTRVVRALQQTKGDSGGHGR